MNFTHLAEQAQITFHENAVFDGPWDEYLVRENLNVRVKFTINSCGHDKITSIKGIIKGFNCATCTSNRKLAEKYLQTKNININFKDCCIECLDCERKYYRLPEVFKNDLNRWQCYCKGSRTSEVKFYDFLVENVPGVINRSFSGYGAGTNYSSDFLIEYNEKKFIIHFDDESHRNQINRKRDLIKLRISDPLGYGNIFIQRKVWIQHPDEVLAHLLELLEGPAEMRTISDGGKFYDYLQNFRLEPQ